MAWLSADSSTYQMMFLFAESGQQRPDGNMRKHKVYTPQAAAFVCRIVCAVHNGRYQHWCDLLNVKMPINVHGIHMQIQIAD